MPIEVRCDCGKRLRVHAELAGRKVKCPGCGAAVAVAARRGELRTWVWERSAFENLIVLTGDTLFAAKLPSHELNAVRDAIERGARPGEVFADGATVVPLRSLTGVDYDRNGGYVSLRFDADGKARTKCLFVKNGTHRDELYEGLKRRLGFGWRARTFKAPLALATVVPAGCLTLAAFLTLAFWLAAREIEEGGPRFAFLQNVFGKTLAKIGTFGVTVFGAVLILAALAWLVRQLVWPPVMVYLERDDRENN